MSNLDRDPSKFFIYLLFVYVTTMSVTALYRMLAALSSNINDAVRFAGLALNLLVIYTGYAIPLPQLLGEKIWFGWVSPFLFCEVLSIPLWKHMLHHALLVLQNSWSLFANP